jgi:hypothetical protein
MVMVARQHSGMHTPTQHLASLGQRFEKETPVIIIAADAFPLIAPAMI